MMLPLVFSPFSLVHMFKATQQGSRVFVYGWVSAVVSRIDRGTVFCA